jgi:hypothetical protein
MSTIREQIVTAAVLALNTARPSGVPVFIRTRIDSPTAAQLPANTVVQAGEVPEPIHPEARQGQMVASRGPVIKSTVVIKVETLTKATSSVPADSAADPSIEWAARALAAAGSLTNLAKRAPDRTGLAFEYAQSDCDYCRATLTFEYQFQTRADDPSRKT